MIDRYLDHSPRADRGTMRLDPWIDPGLAAAEAAAAAAVVASRSCTTHTGSLWNWKQRLWNSSMDMGTSVASFALSHGTTSLTRY